MEFNRNVLLCEKLLIVRFFCYRGDDGASVSFASIINIQDVGALCALLKDIRVFGHRGT